MNQTIITTFLLLTFLTGSGLAQTVNAPPLKPQKTETVRLHIDGFSKSKSGAV